MFEADLLCDTIALINKGRLVALGTPAEIKTTFSKTEIVEVTVREVRQELVALLSGMEGVERVDTGLDGAFQRFTLHARPGARVEERVRQVVAPSAVERIVARDPTLEEAYLNILR
jgi:ABC-2 type transport system ATP-binding protein